MKTNGYYILAFDSTHHAIRVEEQLKQRELGGEMVPTPRDIDASCGLSIRFLERNLELVRDLVDSSKNRVRLYRVDGVGGKAVYIEQEL
ncbi:MAG: DUF3343 domain-containing protein [Bacillota bacterium]|jgi:hypothetical protein|nr:DUF3343 domain-containing protein [Bacillota bacterium]MDD3298012.1 DUF3343 domain-containing protein [Bacillota bacterium]MDD3850043.1 DUF3343 domain-containing protein [Bacillota bacterium]MDD4706720.1 DUF3343 domain-containing protein [Bacillota bacterium]